MSGKKKSFLDFFKMDDSDEEYDEYDEDFFDEDDDDDEDVGSSFPSFGFRKDKNKKADKAPVKEEPSYTPPSNNYKPHPTYTSSYSGSTTRTAYSQPQPQAQQQNSSSSRKSGITRSNDNLVSFNNAHMEKKSPYKPSSEVYVIKPVEIDDAQTVVDFLTKGRAIVVNMEGLALEPAQRIIDFIGGACYGINGELKAISSNIFIAVPSNMEVSGDLREEILTSPNLSE